MDAWPLGGVLCTCVCSHPCASDRRCTVKWCLHHTCCLAFPAGVGADNQTPIFLGCPVHMVAVIITVLLRVESSSRALSGVPRSAVTDSFGSAALYLSVIN